ncbi:MAG: VWA domain-containing protein [Phycisphaerales bacterium]|nr:VWA domain-containing protein [Phycisphaerales bacterium]
MSLLSPFTALLVAGVAVPALLLLYFLKLRRKEVWIGSTMLWSKVVEDLQANTPFQRLRASWLLFLQLLLLLALLLALARPIFGTRQGEGGQRIILLIDVSASMGARDAKAQAASAANDNAGGQSATRLDRAKASANEMLDRLRRSGDEVQVMVVAFATRARIAQTFTSDLRFARAAIDALDVLEEPGLLGPALRLAETYAGPEQAGGGAAPVRTVLLGDGRFGDDQTPSYAAGEVEFISVAAPGDDSPDPDNVGITFLAARRDLLDPSQVDVLCGLLSTAAPLKTVQVEFALDGEPLDTQAIALEARDPRRPAEGLARLRFTNLAGGVLRISIARSDDLATDNTVGLLLAPPTTATLLVVYPISDSGPDEYLMSVVNELPLYEVETWPADRFEAALAGGAVRSGDEHEFSAIIFDRVSPGAVPEAPSLSIGARPPMPGLSLAPSEVENPSRRVLSWSRQHPIMASVGLDTIAVADGRRISLPDEHSEALALAEGGPIIGVVEPRRGRRHLIVSFDLRQSNWPLHVSFAIFIQNAVDYLTQRGSAEAGQMIRTGATMTLRAEPGASQVRLTGPDERTIPVREDGTVTIGPLDRAGVYEAQGLPAESEPIIANLLSETESNLLPVDEVAIGHDAAPAQALDRSTPRELWPWLVALALAILGIEWAVYLLRARWR